MYIYIYIYIHTHIYRYLNEQQIPSEKCLVDPMLCAGDALERISRPQVPHFFFLNFFWGDDPMRLMRETKRTLPQ